MVESAVNNTITMLEEPQRKKQKLTSSSSSSSVATTTTTTTTAAAAASAAAAAESSLSSSSAVVAAGNVTTSIDVGNIILSVEKSMKMELYFLENRICQLNYVLQRFNQIQAQQDTQASVYSLKYYCMRDEYHL